MSTNKFDQAIQNFDAYNSNDSNMIVVKDLEVPNNLRYGQRMTKKLIDFHPDASEWLRLAARCQHIGRWEIPRKDYPMDRAGYLQWRNQLKMLHAKIAGQILEEVGYDSETIEKVRALVMKKQLKQNPETQILEDVVCLVFLQYYFDDFSEAHDEDKVVNILKKTIAKMSAGGLKAALNLPLSDKARALISKASS